MTGCTRMRGWRSPQACLPSGRHAVGCPSSARGRRRTTTASTADVAVADQVRGSPLDLQLAVARPDVNRLLHGGGERSRLGLGAEERLVVVAAIELDAGQR